MKHHFADLLDRSGGHWSIVPNSERHQHRIGDLRHAPSTLSVLTLTAEDQHWEGVSGLPHLEELTLHEPSHEQLEFVSSLWRLKRLRISHARPTSLDFLARLQNLEELVLEYVSGFDDLAPVGGLKNLRALHLENLRRVSDYSGLTGSPNLRYLSIIGTLDWNQPVEAFDFLSSLDNLEYLRLWTVKSLAPSPALLPLTRLRNLKTLRLSKNLFALIDYALMETAFPSVDGAISNPCVRSAYRYLPLHSDDIRSRLPSDEIAKRHPEVQILWDGRREIADPDSEHYDFLGKGNRPVSCLAKTAESRRNDALKAYDQAKKDAQKLLGLT